MKAYFSVSELLDFGLPELPKTKVGLGDKIKRENWQFREVAGRGGKGGHYAATVGTGAGYGAICRAAGGGAA